MKYAKIKYFDVANGPGVRTSLFVSGCNFGCKGCFNLEAQNFKYGELYTEQTEKDILNSLSNTSIAGLSLLGGDPFGQNVTGVKLLTSLCRKAKEKYPNKNIWLWTGYTFEQLLDLYYKDCYIKMIFPFIDVLVDGPFIESLKNLNLQWRGSSNQRIISFQESLLREWPINPVGYY